MDRARPTESTRRRQRSAFRGRRARAAQGRPVGRVAETVGLCERHLERLFYEHAGLAPKIFARIVRFRRAVIAARRGVRLATAAAAYADQAHFNRDVRDLTGCAPRSLLPNVGSVQDVVAGEM